MAIPAIERAGATALTDHLRAHVGDYVPTGLALRDLQLLSQRVRQRSCIYRFQLRSADGALGLVVKVPTAPCIEEGTEQAMRAERPRVVQPPESTMAVQLEYEALARIHEYFEHLGDPRFGTVRPFGIVQQHRAIVMEAVDAPTLKEQVIKAGRWPCRRSREELATTFAHAGAWLRTFHRCPTPPGSTPVESLLDDLVRFVHRLTRFLAAQVGEREFLEWVAGAVEERARYCGGPLPTGAAHGDFALRNIVVGSGQRVTVFDTLGRFRTATYRDIGYFLTDLRVSRFTALAKGALLHRPRCEEYRHAFLRGYFDGDPYSEDAIRLFEVQALLERWSAIVTRRRRSLFGLRVPIARSLQPLVSALFRQAISERLPASPQATSSDYDMQVRVRRASSR